MAEIQRIPTFRAASPIPWTVWTRLHLLRRASKAQHAHFSIPTLFSRWGWVLAEAKNPSRSWESGQRSPALWWLAEKFQDWSLVVCMARCTSVLSVAPLRSVTPGLACSETPLVHGKAMNELRVTGEAFRSN